MTEWEWYYDLPCRVLFQDLLLRVNYETKTYQGIIVKPGMLVTSLTKLVANSGLSIKQVRLALAKLESTGEVVTQRTNQGTIITLSNWSKYQVSQESFDNFKYGRAGKGNLEGNGKGNGKGNTTKEINKEEINNTTGGVNSTDYFGVKGADLRSSESDTNSAILWTELNTLWSTPEYEATLNKLYKTYWVKIAQSDQESLLKFLRSCSDPNLSKVWKKPLFESGPVTPELLTKELVKYVKSKTQVYINESNEQLVQGKKRIDFKTINKT